MNALRICCPTCGTAYRVLEAHVGKRIRCRRCEAIFPIAAPGKPEGGSGAASEPGRPDEQAVAPAPGPAAPAAEPVADRPCEAEVPRAAAPAEGSVPAGGAGDEAVAASGGVVASPPADAAEQAPAVAPAAPSAPAPPADLGPAQKARLEEAALRLDRGKGNWLVLIPPAVVLAAGLPFLPPWGTIVATIGGFIAGLIVVGVLQAGPWGTQGILKSLCREGGWTFAQLLPHLPPRLANAPDVLESLAAEGLEQEMKARLEGVASRVSAALAAPSAVDEQAVREAAAGDPEQGLRGPLVAGGDPAVARIQAVDVVGRTVAERLAALIQQRCRIAGEVMLQNLHVETSALMQAAVAKANADMTQDWRRYYKLYAVLCGGLMPVLRGWNWEEALDTIMGWPGDLRPFPALAAFLQDYWMHTAGPDRVPPKLMAGRAMAWVYRFPDRWETISRTLEIAAVHDAALRGGQVVPGALKAAWREFAREAIRQAGILQKRPEHASEAKTAIERAGKL